MSGSVSDSPGPGAMSAASEDFDVLTLCEIWLALDFPEPATATTVALPDPEEAP